jgi:CRP-like cAMP-binding protein
MPDHPHPLWANLFRPRPDRLTEAARLWKATPLFQSIPEAQCRALVQDMHFRSYAPEEPVFHQGDLGAGAVLIRSGRVAVRAGSQTLAELASGDFFGEVALVTEETRTANVVCTEDSELIFLLRPNLEEWIRRSPEHGAQFMANLAGVLAGRLRHANALLSGTGDGHD